MAAINNPANSFTISKTKSEIFDAVKKIAFNEKHKFSIVNEDDMLNRIRLREAAVIGNNGYNIEFSLSKISENEFTVKIETSRERGGLDTPIEVDNANYILKDVTDKFSSYLSGNLTDKGIANIPNKGTGCVVFFGIMIIVSMGIFMIGCKKETATRCYECKNIGGLAGYQDAGCMTGKQWDEVQFTDANGNLISKEANCRKK